MRPPDRRSQMGTRSLGLAARRLVAHRDRPIARAEWTRSISRPTRLLGGATLSAPAPKAIRRSYNSGSSVHGTPRRWGGKRGRARGSVGRGAGLPRRTTRLADARYTAYGRGSPYFDPLTLILSRRERRSI
jgi:hypothetical protein